MRTALLAVLLFFGGVAIAAAQAADVACFTAAPALPGVGGEHADYVRVTSLLTEQPSPVLVRRPSVTWDLSGPCALWRNIPAAGSTRLHGWLDVVVNTGYPHGSSTGLLWPGRGVQTVLAAGASARYRTLSIGIFPQIAYHQNRPFPTVPVRGDTTSLRYPWHAIDWPQRQGRHAFWSAGLGQSYARVDVAGFGAGISTENLWWGPAFRNSLLLGNEAPGFPHAFAGTSDGWSGRLGRLDAQLVWGRTAQSEYFDTISTNDHRLWSGVVVAWQAPGAAGVSLGLARIFVQPWDSLGVEDFIPFAQSPLKDDLRTPENPMGRDRTDQLAGAFVRWAFPGSGLEIYGELARNDHAQNKDDFLAEPDHASAFTLGFQQVFAGDVRWYRVRGEMTSLSVAPPRTHRPTWPWYVHAAGGYTHRGQLLGAGIGPGSDSQFLGADVFTTYGRHGVHLERVRYDEDAYQRFPNMTFYMHDVELSAGTTHFVRLGNFDVRAGIEYSSRRNRNFRHCNSINGNYDYCQRPKYRDRNWHIPLGISWRP